MFSFTIGRSSLLFPARSILRTYSSSSPSSLRTFPCTYSTYSTSPHIHNGSEIFGSQIRSFPRIPSSSSLSSSLLLIPSRQIRTSGPLKKPKAPSKKIPTLEALLEQGNQGVPPLGEPAKSDPELHTRILEFIETQKVDDVVSIEMKPGVCRWASHFVIVTAKSARHLQAVCQTLSTELRKELKKDMEFQVDPNSEDWNIVKFGGVVVHIMSPKARAFYELEKLWMARNEGKVSDEPFGEVEEEEEENSLERKPATKKKTKLPPAKKLQRKELDPKTKERKEKREQEKKEKKEAKKEARKEEGTKKKELTDGEEEPVVSRKRGTLRKNEH